MSYYTVANKVVKGALGVLVRVEKSLAESQARSIAKTEAKRKAQTQAALQEVEYLQKVIKDTNEKAFAANREAVRKCAELSRQRSQCEATAQAIKSIQENV